jgi:Fe2+ transport system protein FeoA
LQKALGPATVALPFKELTVTDTLNNLSAGVTAVIDDIVSNHSYTDRLKSMGFQSGQSVQVLRQTAHVMHVRVGSTEWAIRNQDAELVKIIPENPSKVHGRDC